ncbi:MAG: DUF2188 domain-containing protein [Verrucomicrobia bacterium]|nr:DUF2188 domain-containing protein [Verrucomicrobiota bacterium]
MSHAATLHVAPSGDGSWFVQKSCASRASARKDSRAEAVVYARRLASTSGLSVYVHAKDGRVLSRISYAGQVSATR